MLVLLHATAVAVLVAKARRRRGGGGIVAHRKKMSSFGIIKSSFEACQRPIVADFSSFRNNIKCILLLFTYSGAAAAAAAAVLLPPLPRRTVGQSNQEYKETLESKPKCASHVEKLK